MDNLERWTEIFEMNFRKMSVPFDFEPEFFGNFGRMERALHIIDDKQKLVWCS